MRLTVKIKLVADSSSARTLRELLVRVNNASTYVALIARSTSTYSKYKLMKLTYDDLKLNYGLGGGVAQLAALRAAKCYSNKKWRNKTVRFSPTSAISLDGRVFSYKKNDIVSIWTPAGRLKVPFQCHRTDIQLSSKIEAKLVLQDGVFYIHQPVEVVESPPINIQSFLGVDLGIKNIAVDSDGVVHSGNHLNALRKRALKLRKKLQKKGTKSAKRLLKKRSKKEKRFATDVNHRISKKIVQKAKDTLRGVALEDLANIRERLGRKKATSKSKQSITVSKPQRSALNSWSFYQLRSFIEYKALRDGVPVSVVFPHYTSQRCFKCGYIHKSNRKTQSEFICNQCGYATNADYNAACNISYAASRGVRLSPIRGEVCTG